MNAFPKIGDLVKDKALGRTYRVVGISPRNETYGVAKLEEVGWDNGPQWFDFFLNNWETVSE